MRKLFPFILPMLLSFILALPIQAKTLIEDEFVNLDNLTKPIDEAGNGNVEVEVENDSSAPAHGPEVLSLNGDCAVYFKNFEFTDGVIEALWKDVETWEDPGAADADGVLIARAQDIVSNKSTPIPEGGGTYWVEHDTDGGFQFKKSIPLDVLPPEGDEETFVKLNDGHFTTGDWNKTGWIWVKWQLDGPHLLAKYWSTAESEPSEWTIEATDDTYTKGFAGLGVWSGHAHIAYIRISDLAGPTAVDKADKLSTTWGSIKTK